jgi:prepilin-type N-terminal cleavage/methylation domain-containing protein
MNFQRGNSQAFTLVELLSVIAVMAVLIATAIFFVPSYISWARLTTANANYATLNETLDRYKQGCGNIQALTVGAPINDIFAALKTPVTLPGNMCHQFLDSTFTYPGRSLQATGNYQQYHFYQVDTYCPQTLPTGTPTSQYPYGQGVGYVSNAGVVAENLFKAITSSGFFAVENASGAIMVYANGSNNIGTSNSFTFWSCVGPAGAGNGTNSAASGNITLVQTDNTGNQNTALNIQGLTALTSLNTQYDEIASLDVHGLMALTTLNCQPSYLTPNLISLNVAGCTALQTIAGESFSGALNISNLPALQNVNMPDTTGSLSFSNCPNLTSITFNSSSWKEPSSVSFSNLPALNAVHVGGAYWSQANFNPLFAALPTVSSGTLYIGSNTQSGLNTSVATGKGWTISTGN